MCVREREREREMERMMGNGGSGAIVYGVAMVLVVVMVALGDGAESAQKGAPGCIGENGSPVDWFAVLKVPNGAMYAYIDPTMYEKDPTSAEWKVVEGKTLAENKGNAVAETLQQLYDDAGATLAYVQYNDQAPSGKKATSYQGHSKGVWATGEGGGFWLLHSVPRYPDAVSTSNDVYPGMPEYENRYGQSFLCLSLDTEKMDAVAEQFYYNRAAIFDFKEVPELTPRLPNFTKFVQGAYSKDPVTNEVDITTRSGKFHFTSFAKTHYWDDYMYLQLVAEKFDTNLLVETWMNGINPDPTFCKGSDYKYSIMNVRHVAVADDLYGSIDWKETQDHSKWCVSTDSTPGTKVACIGDINRQRSQNGRPGGTVCIENEALWTAFTKAIIDYDQCS